MTDKFNDVQRCKVVQFCKHHDDLGFEEIARLLSQLLGTQVTREDVYAMYLHILIGDCR